MAYVLAVALLLAVVTGGFAELCRNIMREVTGEGNDRDN
jgi:hypothetical protein